MYICDALNFNIDVAIANVSTESTIASTTPSSDDETSIGMGVCQPPDVVPGLIGKISIKTIVQE
jgi:hypothetical protein